MNELDDRGITLLGIVGLLQIEQPGIAVEIPGLSQLGDPLFIIAPVFWTVFGAGAN